MKTRYMKSRLMKAKATDLKKYSPFLIGFGSIAIVATAWWLISKSRRKDYEEKPPKRAPQLNIENPGSQDEFIPAASDSGLG